MNCETCGEPRETLRHGTFEDCEAWMRRNVGRGCDRPSEHHTFEPIQSFVLMCLGNEPRIYGTFEGIREADIALLDHMHGEEWCDNNVEFDGHSIERCREVGVPAVR